MDKRLLMCGIYSITNTINGDRYIGSAVVIKKRRATHLHNLKNNKHNSIHLQRAFNLYKLPAFKFEILATCPKEYRVKLEQWFIDNLKPAYNILKVAYSSLGFKQSLETVEKLRLRQLNMSQETKDKIAKSLTGKKHTQAAKDKVSAFNKGKKVSLDVRLTESYARSWFSKADIIEVFNLRNANYTLADIAELTGLPYTKIGAMLDDSKYILMKEDLGLKKLIYGKRKSRLL